MSSSRSSFLGGLKVSFEGDLVLAVTYIWLLSNVCFVTNANDRSFPQDGSRAKWTELNSLCSLVLSASLKEGGPSFHRLITSE